MHRNDERGAVALDRIKFGIRIIIHIPNRHPPRARTNLRCAYKHTPALFALLVTSGEIHTLSTPADPSPCVIKVQSRRAQPNGSLRLRLAPTCLPTFPHPSDTFPMLLLPRSGSPGRHCPASLHGRHGVCHSSSELSEASTRRSPRRSAGAEPPTRALYSEPIA